MQLLASLLDIERAGKGGSACAMDGYKRGSTVLTKSATYSLPSMTPCRPISR